MVEVQDAEGVASHSASESCAGTGNRDGEAWTGVRAGRVWSRERRVLSECRPSRRMGKATRWGALARVPQDSARSETPSMHARTSSGNREIPRLLPAVGAGGRIGKSKDVRR
jgi:hypothetical protein